eukprot:5293994-Prymnesium_polylepis.1
MAQRSAQPNVGDRLPLGQHLHHLKAQVLAILADHRSGADGVCAVQNVAPFPDVPSGLLHARRRRRVDRWIEVVADRGSRGRRCCATEHTRMVRDWSIHVLKYTASKATKWRSEGFCTCKVRGGRAYYLLTYVRRPQPRSGCRPPACRCTAAAW